MIAVVVAENVEDIDVESFDATRLVSEVINRVPTGMLWGAHWEVDEGIDLERLRSPLFRGWSPHERDVRTGDGNTVKESLWGYPVVRHAGDALKPAFAFISDRDLRAPADAAWVK